MNIADYKNYEPIDGKWYFTKKLGSGAYGTVFEVERHDFTNMKAALKIISVPLTSGEVDSFREENYDMDEQSITSYFYDFVKSFQNEIQIMMQLSGNSNIVSYMNDEVIKRENEIGWDIFILMELLTPMNKYFAEKSPEREDIIKLGIDICKALEVCGSHNIIHRDIKPSNIFVSDMGNFKLGDFGVARTLEKTSGMLSKKGTVTYMSPEVYKGEKYGAATDIYSLGIVMYKLLNNNMEPFRNDRTFADAEHANFMRMTGETMPFPINADCELGKIVLKACSYNSNDRYASASEMRKALESILHDKNHFASHNNSLEITQKHQTKQNLVQNAADDHHIDKIINPFDLIEISESIEEIDKTVSLFDEMPAATSKVNNNTADNNKTVGLCNVNNISQRVNNSTIFHKKSQDEDAGKSKTVSMKVSEMIRTGYKMRSLKDMDENDSDTEPDTYEIPKCKEITPKKTYSLSELSQNYRMRSVEDIEK